MVEIISDFSLEDDYKPTPYHPKGSYRGTVTDIEYTEENGMIASKITLNNNPERMMSDGVTRCDGKQVTHRVFIPLPGNESEFTKSGQNLKQFKINQLYKFFKNLGITGIDNNTLGQAIEQKAWVGRDVIVTLSTGTFMDETTNNVDKMVLDPEGEGLPE